MKERTRAQIRAGATHTRSMCFGSRSVEKELRNWAWNGKCRVTERASWPAPRHWQTNQRTHTSITQLAAPRHMKNARGELQRTHLFTQHGPGVSLPRSESMYSRRIGLWRAKSGMLSQTVDAATTSAADPKILLRRHRTQSQIRHRRLANNHHHDDRDTPSPPFSKLSRLLDNNHLQQQPPPPPPE